MMEIASGVSLVKDLFQFLKFLKGVAGAGVISAYFKYDATKIEGSSEIDVDLIKTDKNEIFWFTVKAVDDYIFIRFPLNDSGCEEIIGTVDGEVLPNPNCWRWVQAARSGTIVDGRYRPPNAKVDFAVVGYKPKAIIKYLSSSP